jgi:hypothetical protein
LKNNFLKKFLKRTKFPTLLAPMIKAKNDDEEEGESAYRGMN